jgi:hypothetical protein
MICIDDVRSLRGILYHEALGAEGFPALIAGYSRREANMQWRRGALP